MTEKITPRISGIVCFQAKKNREISSLQRRIDEVPSRSELSQYQRRFVELYNQGIATANDDIYT